ncbi:MAG TPA: hydroxysqualene dehydroxylase HpnE [Solirubrobacteraceae bacterium]|nr:hydroxysqualene dehydroxylase HpnE [Solirubrobacteraceae bacterium]
MSAPRVAVLGGGVAGITAALDCAEAGARVTLIEVRPRLGGAAYSFERDGLLLDNGQHVFLRCYTAYRTLLARLGSEGMVRLQERFEIPVLRPGGERMALRRSRLPAPLHLAGALARYSYLSPLQRVRAAFAALALGRLDPDLAAVRERAEGTSLGQWLCEHGQDQRSLALLWDLIALPALNVPALQGSLSLGAFTLREGLLSRNDAGDIGFHLRPFGEVIAAPAERALAAAGVELRLSARAEAVRRNGGRLTVGVGGEEVEVDTVICALQHTRAAALLRPLLGAQATDRWRRLGTSPIVNLHVVYDRRVCDLEFAAGVDTPMQYVFDRSEAVGLADGQCLGVSLSGAQAEMAMEAEQLRRHCLDALAELLPGARGASVRGVHISREHAATFAATPGVDALRPITRTGVPGLLLAGAWTRTGWPATLEGAVRSGHAAARAAVAVAASAEVWAAAPGVSGEDPARAGRVVDCKLVDRTKGGPCVSDVLIVSPLGVEAMAVRSAAPGMRVRTTGMGPRKAMAAVPALAADEAAALVIVGFGGGLAQDSRLCEVVVAEEVLAIDSEGRPAGERIDCSIAERLERALTGHGLPTCRGTVASVQEIVVGAARERMLASGAIAVDMESAWVAEAARGRPFAVVRVLSDTPEHELRRRLPVGPPLPTLANSVRAMSRLREVAAALGRLRRQGELHTVFGLSPGEQRSL